MSHNLAKQPPARFAEVVAVLEQGTRTDYATVGWVLGVSVGVVRDTLQRGGYSYAALLAERQAIAREVRDLHHELLRQRKAAEREARRAPCGTKAAYHRHLRNGEAACIPCLDATAEYHRQLMARLRDERRPDRRRDPPEVCAKRSEALRRLYRGDAA